MRNSLAGMQIVKKSKLLLIGVLVLATHASAPSQNLTQFDATSNPLSTPVESKIDSLLALMTLEEKAGQLTQFSRDWWSNANRTGIIKDEHRPLLKQGRIGSFLNVYGSEVTKEIQRMAVEESRLHIPLLFGFDVIHGFRTTFPIPLAEAASWDPAAVEQSARVAATEAAAAGVHWTFAPMVDIARDPRWGRIAEGSGEDPYLGSVMAAARVRGFQGHDFSGNNSILACAKHFAAYGGAEGGRDYNTVDMSERTLREIYLAPFKAAVDAGAATLMSSFNEISGIPSSANRWLLSDLLRHEWGFNGFVVSDWNSIGELHTHGLAATPPEAGMLALTAGVDMDMEGSVYVHHLPQLVREGKLSESTLNQAVRRVLRAKFQFGLFDDPYKYCNPELERSVTLSATHLEAARAMAQKSIVLLKNEKNLLPLKKDLRQVAVIGPLADDQKDPLGPWAAVGRPSDVVTVLAGIKKLVSPQTKVLYAKGCEIEGGTTNGFADAIAIARKSEVAIVVVGEAAEMSGEAACRSSLDLPGHQEALVKAIHATGKPVVVVLMNGRPLSIPWIANNIPAILETWFLGVQTGNAIADVLFGDYNPGGKLPATFPRTVGQIPIYYNHKNTGRPGVDGQPYNSRYLDVPVAPLYPFGYGLSYTKFEYSDLQLSAQSISPNDSLKISITVKNTGSRAGDEVVQLYIRDEYASVTRPVKELKGFRRITLIPGEGKKVEFTLAPEQLAFYDRDMQLVVEPGTFKVYVGTNSVEVQEAGFTVVGEKKVFAPGMSQRQNRD
ncbi:MAG: glycoside hydrolase family 3 C-terminal domain-containing protein [candidate division KSB1 bacterium]|nr:glycoside hydrolase family 3 C-terminal domain-containing protein [candidate division KSB1 bacterium]MDZ7301888.1 glycoside hydrolase family 3 C-terminal domain-containing protein [candidate division KSB1 bacterium]MDZ7310271.1 glycoside hydrolase family 3 C-terminal domain-containing protein [candidate division KSB1 bacterium]